MTRKDNEPPKQKSLSDLLHEDEVKTNKELEELKKEFNEVSQKLLNKYHNKDKE